MDRPKDTRPSQAAQAHDVPELPVSRPYGWVAAVSIILIVAVLAVAVVWAEPRPNGDLDTALAVGRDVMDGKLGRPDDWAFTTAGRVCINQNWGSQLLHYLTYQAAGPAGLLVLKAAFIAASALFICMAARERRVSWPVALLVAAGAIAAGRSYIDLRANLTTLAFAPLALWLLLKTRRNVHWIWPVMILNGLWANMHGGFIFGLGMIGLWVVVLCTARAAALIRTLKPPSAALKTAAAQLWPLPTALAGSVALATFANPYGPINLTFPLAITDPAWQRLREWWPLLAKGSEFGTAWEFLAFMGILGGLLLLRVAGIPGVAASHLRKPTLDQGSQALFDVLLTAVVVTMTFKARRFVPLAVIVSAPFLAAQVQWLMDLVARAHRALPLAAMAAAAATLAVPLLVHAEQLRRIYHPRNPNFPPETFFDRMHMRWVQPTGAARFLAANQVSGRIFHEWEWEGYLHWTCPDLKLFIGGRAHQVYDPATDTLANRILADPRRYRVDPAADLAGADVHLVVIPIDPKHLPLIWCLVERSGAYWTYVYCDPREMVLADLAWPQTADLVRRAIAGDLTYPDQTSAALSRALAMQSPRLNIPARQKLDALLAAVRLRPTSPAYRAIWELTRGMSPGDTRIQQGYFGSQYGRLADMDPNQADGMQTLTMRAQLAMYLADLCLASGDAQQALRWKQAQAQALAEVQAVAAYWP